MYFFFYVRKGKGKKEEEKPKEVIQVSPTVQEEINLENSLWVPPVDLTLMDYINDVSKTILPLTTTREQVVALAQWVPKRIFVSGIGKITVFLSKVIFFQNSYFPMLKWNRNQLWSRMLTYLDFKLLVSNFVVINLIYFKIKYHLQQKSINFSFKKYSYRQFQVLFHIYTSVLILSSDHISYI